jgi:hypothetical protein
MRPETLSAHRLLDRLLKRTHFVRGQKVVLDRDVASVYSVSIGTLKRALSRNRERFPAEVVFQLTKEECSVLKNPAKGALNYAFTEEGILLLSSVLNSLQAIQTSIDVIRELCGFRSN